MENQVIEQEVNEEEAESSMMKNEIETDPSMKDEDEEEFTELPQKVEKKEESVSISAGKMKTQQTVKIDRVNKNEKLAPTNQPIKMKTMMMKKK